MNLETQLEADAENNKFMFVTCNRVEPRLFKSTKFHVSYKDYKYQYNAPTI